MHTRMQQMMRMLEPLPMLIPLMLELKCLNSAVSKPFGMPKAQTQSESGR